MKKIFTKTLDDFFEMEKEFLKNSATNTGRHKKFF